MDAIAANRLNWDHRAEIHLRDSTGFYGIDTMRLARRGALATGLDFSPRAIAGARALSAELGLPVRFVEGDVHDAATLLDGPFDLVYVTWGRFAGCRL